MINTYAAVKLLAAVGTVTIFALFVGAYKLVQAAVENRRRIGISGKPALSAAE